MGQYDEIDTVAIAQGIIMGARNLDPEDAGLVLLVLAEEQARSLIEVAADIVESGYDRNSR